MPTPNKVDPARIRALLAANTRPAAIAGELGVNHATISYWRKRLGLAPLDRRTLDRGRIAELHARGWADEAIAGELGCARTGVTKARRQLGLPAHRHKSATFKPRMRAHWERRTRAAGVSSLRSLNPDAYAAKTRAVCRRYGLPVDLYRAQALVLLALARGPKTAAELAAETGRGQPTINPYHRFNFHACPGGNYLTDLGRRGLVAWTDQGARRVYLLTAQAMDLLSHGPTDPPGEPQS